ncbi:RimK-like protein [Bradyrhizobium ontarionense]|uniref:RimK-like protein n=1 Tax=Bradyrhizobium ontarionense TaxID=2898149 RepID=A0ABY3R5A4_9BRAD|nr:RimK-like protein [Bradyrhizobium sp. A19]UFZ02506.1 RimK-like protein [Bradyrhizobium sp. A19]
MPTVPRILIGAIKRYCAERAIALDIRADGWLFVLDHPAGRHLIFGYDLGLNSAVAHRLASDKAAAAELLALSGVPAVPHTFFIAPAFSGRAEPPWPSMFELLEAHPRGGVVKPNEGTSGRSVTRVATRDELKRAAGAIFDIGVNVAVSPFVEIEDEVRVVQLDEAPLIVYRKQRPSVTGDGEQSLQELALAAVAPVGRERMLARLRAELSVAELAAVVPADARRLLNWRHNLEAGATPVLLDSGPARDACVALARTAAGAIGIRFASIDVVQVNGSWQVLEINSGMVMEVLGRFHPDLVYAVYRTALDEIFGQL